ncbi:hypothetical protein ACF0H5_012737 [Mactra antiquata]
MEESLTIPTTKPPMLQRPSTLFFSHTQLSKNDELLLEKRIVNNNYKLRYVFHGFEDCRQCLWNRKYHNVTSFDEINDKLTEKILHTFINLHDEEKIVLGNKMARMGLVEVLVNFYMAMQDGSGMGALSDTMVRGNKNDECLKCLLIIRRILWDYSHCSSNFALALSKTEFVTTLLDDVACCCNEGVQKLDEHIDCGDNMYIFCSAVCMIYNMCRHPYSEREAVRRDGIIYKLKSFLNSKHTHVQMMSLLALVYVIKEEQTSILNTNFDVFDFLIARINDTVIAKDKRESGYHIAELIDSLTCLIESNKTKQYLMNIRPLTMIKTWLTVPNVLENLSAIKLIWELAFLEQNRRILRNDTELVTILQELKLNHDPDIRIAAQKTQFVLQWKESCYKIMSLDNEPVEDHILLSYNWADRSQVNEIYRVLKSEGFPVWIDITEMNKYTDILDCVRRSIYHSKLVLVCYSEKYKRDQNCRTEAEYSYELRRPVIPIRLQAGYEPDGWLRTLLGPKFYLDFTNNAIFDKQMDKLRDCINRYENKTTQVNQTVAESPRITMSRSSSRAISSRISSRAISRLPSRGPSACSAYNKKVQDWSADDIEQWTLHFKFDGRAYRIVSRLTVQQILHIYNTWKKNPESFYKWAESVIHLGSIEDLVRLRNAIKSLTGYI